MYIVKYSRGCYDDYSVVTLFVTDDKETAENYEEKFNNLLSKLKEHYYNKYEKDDHGIQTIKYEYVTDKFESWHVISEINKCFFHEIEKR